MIASGATGQPNPGEIDASVRLTQRHDHQMLDSGHPCARAAGSRSAARRWTACRVNPHAIVTASSAVNRSTTGPDLDVPYIGTTGETIYTDVSPSSCCGATTVGCAGFSPGRGGTVPRDSAWFSQRPARQGPGRSIAGARPGWYYGQSLRVHVVRLGSWCVSRTSVFGGPVFG